MDDIASLALTFDILARDKASSEFKKVGDAAEDAGKRGSTSIGSLSGALKGVGAAFAGSALIAGLGKTVSAASDLNETVNKSNVIFGSNSREIQRWASSASRNLGLSRGAALEAAAGFGNMFTQLGFSGDAATDMSKQVVQLSADLGSFNNLPTAEVADMMSAAFRGEYDSLQRLIPNINATRVEQEALAMTGKAAAKELTAQEKAAATLAIVQRDGAAAAGDFAKTSDGLANSSKIAAAQFEDLQASIGQKFLPAAEAAMGFVADTAIPAIGAFADGAFNLLEAFGDLPGPVQLAAGAAVAWAVAGDRIMSAWGPAKGAFSGLRGTVSSFNEALGYARANGDGLTTVLRSAGSYAGGQVASGFKALGRAIGPELGIGLAVLTVGELVNGYKRLTEASDEAKAAAEGLAGALTLTDAAADRRAVRETIEDVDGLVEVLEAAGVSSRDAIDGLLGQADAQARVTRALQEYMATRRTGQAGGEAADIRELMLAYEELATGYGTAAGSARFFGDQADETATQTEGVANAASQATKEVRALKDRLDDLTGNTISAMEAEANFEAAINDAKTATDDLSGSIKGANGKLDLHTEAGQAAFNALVDLRDSSNDVIDSMRVQGATAEQMAKKDQALRVSFIKTAQQMGFSKQEAKRLADQILGIPAERNTEINAPTDGARRQVLWLRDIIDSVKGKTVNITAQVTATARGLLNWGTGRGDGYGIGDGPGIANVVAKAITPPPRRRGTGDGPGVATLTAKFDADAAAARLDAMVKEMNGMAGPAGPAMGAGVGWQRQWAAVQAAFGGRVNLHSSFRPGSITATGNLSYHALGRAIDITPNMGIFNWLARNYPNSRELIYSPAGGRQLWNGAPHMYSEPTRGDHWDHIHWAMANGGVIREPVIGKGLRTGGNYLLGERGPETVTPGIHTGGRTEIVVHAYTTETQRIANAIAERQRLEEILRG